MIMFRFLNRTKDQNIVKSPLPAWDDMIPIEIYLQNGIQSKVRVLEKAWIVESDIQWSEVPARQDTIRTKKAMLVSFLISWPFKQDSVTKCHMGENGIKSPKSFTYYLKEWRKKLLNTHKVGRFYIESSNYLSSDSTVSRCNGDRFSQMSTDILINNINNYSNCSQKARPF